MLGVSLERTLSPSEQYSGSQWIFLVPDGVVKLLLLKLNRSRGAADMAKPTTHNSNDVACA